VWRGEAADEAKKFRKRYKGPLSDVERAFLDEVVHYENAVKRRRRVAVIGAFIALGALVIAALVVLVIIQSSREDARRNEIAAKAAQKDAEDQLAETQRKEAERAAAEREKLAAEEQQRKVEAQKLVVDTQLGQSKEDLAKKNVELQGALQNSIKAEERAKIQEHLAEDNATAAAKAKEEAEGARNAAVAAQSQTQELLVREKERVEALQKQIGSPAIDQLK
jgi:membrane protein involved in colicin uptake